jgi:hypothetical protein
MIKPKKRQRNIYVIKSGPFVKIGKTDGDLKKRLSTLQIGNPHQMNLSYACNIEGLCTPDGIQVTSFAFERMVHDRLSESRAKGEWFLLHPDEARVAIHELIDEIRYGETDPMEIPMRTTPHRLVCIRVTNATFDAMANKSDKELDDYATEAVRLKMLVDKGTHSLVENSLN